MSSEYTVLFSTAQTDLDLRYRTFYVKINELPAFSEITQVWLKF